jgi:hypothetical protein
VVNFLESNQKQKIESVNRVIEERIRVLRFICPQFFPDAEESGGISPG